jgi:SAM-dependent methyltransferase
LITRQHFDDPVAAYNLLAPHYSDLSRRRELYLRSIEKIIVSRIPAGSKSLLDIGGGDGKRALRIAEECGIQRVVLVEPSREMAAPARGLATVWNIRAEELGTQVAHGPTGAVRSQDRNAENCALFNVIMCMWNVLGHLRSFEDRVSAMRAMTDRLEPDGRFFLDVNHRYNLRSYGVIPTVGRFIIDSVSYKETAADVHVKWNIGGESISTHGHVFTDREIRQLVLAAGLSVEERIVVDYGSGKIRRFACLGNLLYVFRRSSLMDSARAAHTS